MESRRAFYDWLVETIAIDGITEAVRDTEFDDLHYYRSGGIRLAYNTRIGSLAGMKDGIFLEVGFDAVSPNAPYTISSWAYDFAADKVDVIDNRAIDVACYHPGYTFVEKLQTVSTKFRKQQEDGDFPANFMRHYYDIFRLLRPPPPSSGVYRNGRICGAQKEEISWGRQSHSCRKRSISIERQGHSSAV